jgi:hypothetical protein
LAYNRGPDVANRFIAGADDKAGHKYVKSLQNLGAFSGKVQVEDPFKPEPAIEMPEMNKDLEQFRQLKKVLT